MPNAFRGQFMRILNSFRAIVALAAILATSPALAEFAYGEEQILYPSCTWMSGPAEKSQAQIEEIRWRDTITTWPSGNKTIDRHSGVYLSDLLNSLKRRLGTDAVDCEWRKSPTDYRHPPGTSYYGYREMVSVVFSKIDPSWFIVDGMGDNLTVPAAGKKKAPPLPNIANKGASAEASTALPGLVIEQPQASQESQAAKDAFLKAQREQAAIKAKQIADAARYDAEIQAGIARTQAEMRRRGNSQ